jgi:hypothetical protein
VDGTGKRLAGGAIRNELAAEISRRELLQAGGGLGLAAVVAGALPALEMLADPASAHAQGQALDGTLQAYFDTMIPGRVVERTALGEPVVPGAIAGVDPEPGAVEADALMLAHDPRIGFDALAPALVADLEARALSEGGTFLSLDYEARERVCLAGLDFSNPSRTIWEAGAAVPFTAFCAAAPVIDATARSAPGLRVMGHPGTAPKGWRNSSYRRRLARGRTRTGNLP